MHEIPRQVLIKLPPLWGVDLSITNEVILLWIAAALTFVLVTVACRRRSEIAKGPFQNLFEAIIEFLDDAIGHDILGEHGRHRQAQLAEQGDHHPHALTPAPRFSSICCLIQS